MSTIDYGVELTNSDALPARRGGAIRFLLGHYPLGVIGAAIVGFFVFVAVFAPFITAYDPLSTSATLSLRPLAHPIGWGLISWGAMSIAVWLTAPASRS